jgi:hypothetical protein
MQSVELEDFFGGPVFIQFRDGLALVTAGEPVEYGPINRAAEPKMRFATTGLAPLVARRAKPELKLDADKSPSFTLVIQGRIVPGDSERVYVIYETGEHIARLAVRPSDIVAVTWIEGRIDGKPEERLVQ